MKLLHLPGAKINMVVVNQLNRYNPKFIVKVGNWVHVAVMRDGTFKYYSHDKASMPIITNTRMEFYNMPGGGQYEYRDMETFEALINENTVKIKNARSIE